MTFWSAADPAGVWTGPGGPSSSSFVLGETGSPDDG